MSATRKELNRTKFFSPTARKFAKRGYVYGFHEAMRLTTITVHGSMPRDSEKILSLAKLVFEDHVKQTIAHHRRANAKGERAKKMMRWNDKFVGKFRKLFPHLQAGLVHF
jgi:hypothetical protein